MAQHFLLQSGVTGVPVAGLPKENWLYRFLSSPSQLIVSGVFGVVFLLCFFIAAALGAVQTIDGKSVDKERQRAIVAVGLAQQSGQAIDSVIAGKIGRDYLLHEARLAPPAKLRPEETSLPLAGTTLVLAWTPERIGSETFAEIAGPRIGGAVLVLAIVMFILHRLYRLARDLEARRRAAREMATSDPLTGLANRRGFAELLDANFGAGTPVSLLYLDLDGFKQVNDRFGHAAGDQLLQGVAQRLQTAVGPDDFVARLGGDEFVVLRRGPATREQLCELAGGIHEKLTLAYELGNVTASVGLSIGIAVHTQTMTVSQFVASADAALYRAKAVDGLGIVFDETAEAVPRAA
ncbi:MAG: GGDEF domain-containing protein [Devosia sp.]